MAERVFVSKDTRSVKTDRSAAKLVAELFSGETLDLMIKDATKSGGPGEGVESLLGELTKKVLEAALRTETTEHLGYEAGDRTPVTSVTIVSTRSRGSAGRRANHM
jgi:putative transposase